MEERRPEMIWLSAVLTVGAVFGGLVFLTLVIRKGSIDIQNAFSVAGIMVLSALVALLAGGAVAALGFSRGPVPDIAPDPYGDNLELREAERRAREGELD